ncbi:drug/metabolite transporter (DMT)-like permease [Paenibacillus shirakamiensis]|uniref:Drug/metabolite transporter (DMT)-like permease n=1 Tax=Paenibacillus shirakamiensis TaxID=1265935 RepID=A0ABS4JLC7_9BACL|nr:DMT family transporter [Paenibacillus shirakamiensis]MBP2002513.1 drug/metabolite transporter (DMT)-like permease [Paenibacillus shirakamiensis]
MQASKKAYPHLGLLIIGIISIALSSIFIKLSSAPAPVMGMYRLFFCLIFISPWLKWRTINTLLRSLSRKEIGLLFLAGLFLGLHFLLWMESLNHTSVASSMILLSLQPVFVMSGSYLFYRVRTAWSAAAALSLAMVGSILIAWGDIGLSSEALWGDLLSLLGGVAYALYMLTGQNLCKKMPSMVYSFFVFAIGGLLLLGYNLGNGIELVKYSGSNWVIFILLAVVPTIFGQMLFNRLLQVMPASTISMAIIGEPVFAIALAAMFLDEPITAFALVGGAMTLIGIGLYFWVVRIPEAPLQQQPS